MLERAKLTPRTADLTLAAPVQACGRRGCIRQDSGGAWRSLVAHLLWEQRVGGSNPSAPTKDLAAPRAIHVRP